MSVHVSHQDVRDGTEKLQMKTEIPDSSGFIFLIDITFVGGLVGLTQKLCSDALQR